MVVVVKSDDGARLRETGIGIIFWRGYDTREGRSLLRESIIIANGREEYSDDFHYHSKQCRR